MFDITNSLGFYKKLLADVADLQEHPDSARLAVNCAVTAYHLHEWVWGDWLKTDHAAWKKLGIRDKKGFLDWLDAHAPWFQTVQMLANGSKHFMRQASQQTRRTGSFDLAAFDNDAFDVTRLEIEIEGADAKPHNCKSGPRMAWVHIRNTANRLRRQRGDFYADHYKSDAE